MRGLSVPLWRCARASAPPCDCAPSSTFRDDRGVTTVGMAIALFISIALIFSGAQLYRMHSASAEIQEVADACALAAENEVAGLLAVANTCDAVCLSLTLLAVTLYGIGVVAACIPSAQAVSARLIDAANKTVEARARFYEQACTGLDAAQRALPLLATCNAVRVADANETGAMRADYLAAAILAPQGYEKLGSAPDDGLAGASASVSDQIDDIRSKAQEAEDAARRANEAKERGFMEDCGADPAYCMMERASSLAGLFGADNPSYSSVDAWSFQVGLDRARAYYRTRLSIWKLEGRTPEEQADAVIRKRFYQYAGEELERAYVDDGPDGFTASLPHLFRNTDEMRSTPLYVEAIYPVTRTGANLTMHAWSGCPQAAGTVRTGSIQELEATRSSFVRCPSCEFIPSSVGAVAAASTSIANGFENHYEKMRQACEEYAKARAEADPLAAEVKAVVSPLLEALGTVLDNAGSFRIHIEPPGHKGAIALVVNTKENAADTGFESTFISGGATLGTRAAVSAATCIEDGTESAGALATQAASALFPGGGAGGGALPAATGAWMSLLRAYEDGQSALESAVEDGLGSFSQTTASGLGAWGADALSDIIAAAGLEPADTSCQKPQVLNTTHVASSDESSACVRYVQMKDAVLAGSTPSTSILETMLGAAGSMTDGTMVPSGQMPIAQVSLPFFEDGSISWAIPAGNTSTGGLFESALTALRSTISDAIGDRSWQ